VIRVCKFVDRNGILKPSSVQASQLTFEKKSDHMGKTCVLVFANCVNTIRCIRASFTFVVCVVCKILAYQIT